MTTLSAAHSKTTRVVSLPTRVVSLATRVLILTTLVTIVTTYENNETRCINYVNGVEHVITCQSDCCLEFGSYAVQLSSEDVCSGSYGDCSNTPRIPTSCPIVVDGKKEMYGCGEEICCFANVTLTALHFNYTAPKHEEICSVGGVCLDYEDGEDEYDEYDDYDGQGPVQDGQEDEEEEEEDAGLMWWVVLLIILVILLVVGVAVYLFTLFCYRYSTPVHPAATLVTPVEEGLDEKAARLLELEHYLIVAIAARDMAELKLAIHVVEREGFQGELEKKYRQAQDLFKELMAREETEKRRELEEAERVAALAKKALEEAAAEASRRGEEEGAARAREAARVRDEANAKWKRLWPRLQILKALNDVNTEAVDKAMKEARIQNEEEELVRRAAEEKAREIEYCQKLLQHGIDTLDEGKLEMAIKTTQDRNLEDDEDVTELFKKAKTELEKLKQERARREAEAEEKRLAGLAETEEKRLAALAESEEKRLAALAKLEKIRTALRTAITERDIEKLKKSISQVEENNLEESLNPDYEKAKALLDRLEKMEVVKRKIMELDRPLIAELKSFSEPPVPVYRAMMGSYLLMGESRSALKEWSNIVILLNKTGKLSVKRRVQELKLESVSEETALAAQNQILGLTSQEVYEANQAASLFFDWTEMICYERKYLAETTD